MKAIGNGLEVKKYDALGENPYQDIRFTEAKFNEMKKPLYHEEITHVNELHNQQFSHSSNSVTNSVNINSVESNGMKYGISQLNQLNTINPTNQFNQNNQTSQINQFNQMNENELSMQMKRNEQEQFIYGQQSENKITETIYQPYEMKTTQSSTAIQSKPFDPLFNSTQSNDTMKSIQHTNTSNNNQNNQKQYHQKYRIGCC